MTTIIEAKALCKQFVNDKCAGQKVLNNINLSIAKGEFVALMGPSGSGKSTLLYCLCGMEKVTSGDIEFMGNTISDISENALSHIRLSQIGFIFQQMNLLNNLSLLDNIVLPAYLLKKLDRGAANDKAKKLMRQLNIENLIDNDITEASGGQLQRVAICRALINDPDIIIGDEPTGALNSKAANDVMDILKTINKSDKTILLATHDAKIAAECDRVIYLVDGKVYGEYIANKQDINLNQWLANIGF